MFVHLKVEAAAYGFGGHTDPAQMWRSLTPLSKLANFAVWGVGFFGASMLGQAALAWVVVRLRNYEQVELRPLLKFLLPRTPGILLVFIILGALWMFGFAMILLPGLLLGAYIGFAPIIMATQEVGFVRGLRRSIAVASRYLSTSLTIWTTGWFVTVVVYVVSFFAVRPGLAYSRLNLPAYDTAMLVCLAAIEVVMGGALAHLYLQPAETHTTAAAA